MKKIIMLASLIAVLAAFLASTFPDGLDKISGLLGFSSRAIERQSLMTGYTLPFLPSGPISTAAAGIIGVLVVFSLISGIKFFISQRY